MARKFYVVWEGRAPGIYDSWEEAQAQVEGFPGAKYKSFTSQTAATEAFRNDGGDELYALRAMAAHRQPEIINYEAFPEIRLDAIAVDAACAGNPGVMEYRGVVVGTGEELFHYGPVADGTNNVGEFLALVHALALCEQKGWCAPSTPTAYGPGMVAQPQDTHFARPYPTQCRAARHPAARRALGADPHFALPRGKVGHRKVGRNPRRLRPQVIHSGPRGRR